MEIRTIANKIAEYLQNQSVFLSPVMFNSCHTLFPIVIVYHLVLFLIVKYTGLGPVFKILQAAMDVSGSI